ncbi:hypothetical protein ACFOPN_21800 [Xanthomonas hyacinthi]|nr:hypothetical protein [Xanthomonas hyacinthi]
MRLPPRVVLGAIALLPCAKGEDRMRLRYYPMQDGDCVPMGQEILAHASL